MSFADKRTRDFRIYRLHQHRSKRIEKLIKEGHIKSAEEIPKHAIPVDFELSTMANLILPLPYYKDIHYQCVDCGCPATWLAVAQQYYFEILRKCPYNEAVRCSKCQGKRKRGHDT